MSSDSSSSSGSSSDDSSDDELPQTAAPPSGQTGANVRHVVAGTYGKVVAVLGDSSVEVRWEGGDTSTLDADAYEAALRSYAKSLRARGGPSDARRRTSRYSSDGGGFAPGDVVLVDTTSAGWVEGRISRVREAEGAYDIKYDGSIRTVPASRVQEPLELDDPLLSELSLIHI